MNSFRYLSSASLLAVVLAAAVPAAAQNAPLTLPGDVQAAPRPPVSLPDGATLGGSQEAVRNMATEAGRNLDELIGQSLTPREEAHVGELAERQRRIQALTSQVEEAKLARELWVLLNGEDSSKDEEIENLQAERDMLEAEVEFLKQQQQITQTTAPRVDPDPVVAEIVGSGGSVTATVLVPYAGRYQVRRGSELPNGMKVTSISPSGVTVTTQSGGTKTLGFGTSVPSVRAVQIAPSAR